ncbi:MAG: nuclease-related domain-containing protein, partial [Eubacteriales bacterium]|nr:nuclease-related domain-containing protein [Eubacteriales bacterium]
MKVQRIEELMGSMKSFEREGYHKDELLGEMFALQSEIVGLTFNEAPNTSELKIWDVEHYLEELNAEYGHIADEKLASFKEGSKTLCNLIKAEISGNRGEYKAFKTLEYLKSQNKVLKNVELKDGELRTELDAVVVTPRCVTIVEVKNTGKNVFIDEDGNYYRTGEFLRWDSNIAEKMSVKEKLLRTVLEAAGYGAVPVRSIVVFTNNRIEVQNKYRQIRTSFVSQLTYIIDGYRLEETLNIDDMDKLQEAIHRAECRELYPFELDVEQYKMDFAELITTLEAAKEQKCIERIAEEIKSADGKNTKFSRHTNLVTVIKTIFISKRFKYV